MSEAGSTPAFDAVVIGGGVGGLTAAAYLAKGGAKVTLLEARNIVGGRSETAQLAEGFLAPALDHTLYALDTAVVSDLKLYRHGLKFAERDMPLVALRPGGQHLVLPREVFAARAAILPLSVADADAYVRFRRDAFAFARRMRPLWLARSPVTPTKDSGSVQDAVRRLRLSGREARQLETLSRLSAAAYLDGWFQTDALKALLAADAIGGQLSPQEAGSALALIWRYAQESCGLQGCSSQPLGGPGTLAAALSHAAEEAGVVVRTRARVTAILSEGGRVSGVTLETGETVQARFVLSSLDARQTLLDLGRPSLIGLGAAALLPEEQKISGAKILLALNGPPPFAGLPARTLRGRLIAAERPESAAEAKGAALAGQLPLEPVFEAVVPSAADPALAPMGHHILSVLLPYVPVEPEEGWAVAGEVLKKRTIAALESYAPGLSERILAAEILTPVDIAQRYGGALGGSNEHFRNLLTPYEARVRTPAEGVYLCGDGVEPGGAISGRAGRVSAALILEQLKGGKAS